MKTDIVILNILWTEHRRNEFLAENLFPFSRTVYLGSKWQI